MRHQSLQIQTIILSLLLLLIGCQNVNKDKESDPALDVETKFMFLGTYTKKEGHVDGKAEGIRVFRISEEGDLISLYTAEEAINPSFLAVSSEGKTLYAVNETGPDVDSTGSISAYDFDISSGELNLLNRQPSYGFAPCYITVDSENRLVFTVNYVGGIVAVYPLEPDGKLSKASHVVKLEGQGPDPRQEASHPHSILLSPDERFAYVADLGTDRIMIYHVDYDQGKLLPAGTPFMSLKAGSGPRHMAFHPNGRFLYAINELNNSIVCFSYDGSSGNLNPVQTINTLPDGFEGSSFCADIHITGDGKFLYGTNRGHNSLAAFGVDGQDGTLSLIGHTSTRGDHPRNFLIDGNHLYVANQNTDNIVLFEIAPDGSLEFIREFDALTPVCLKVLEID